MCENFPEKLAFAFLTDVQKSFIEKYDYDKIASFFSYQLTEFDQNLSKLISYYNACPQKTQTGELIQELIDAKNIAIENIEKVLERKEKLSIMADKSERLNNESRNINYIADQLRKQARKKQKKTMMMVGGSIIVCILLLFFMLF